LKNRDEAEDAIQSAYLRGFGAIRDFAGKSSLTTWLTRIVINEALGRLRAAKRRRSHLEDNSVVFLDDYREKLMNGSTCRSSPEASVARGQIRQMLEDAIARLPSTFRMVFILRDVEGLSVAEVAETLDIAPATVKTRHLRARRRLQNDLAPELRNALTGTFPFAGADCEKLTERVVRAFVYGGDSPRAKMHEGITEEALEALVDSFYAKARRDPLIGPVFNAAIAHWPEHLEKLQSFWSSVMLTSGRYKGRPLPAHIKHAEAISPASFERWLAIWGETTNELLDRQSAAALQEKAGRIAESLSLGIRFHRERDAVATPARVD
jgi:RNA polymerase sigma-70 factor, ECF subfamily